MVQVTGEDVITFVMEMTEESPGSGRPSTLSAPESLDHVHDLIFADRRISTKTVTETLLISKVYAGSINDENLSIQKMLPYWLLKCLKADEKRNRVGTFKLIFCSIFEQPSNTFLGPLLTGDEAWLHHYHHETRQQSLQWRYSGSPVAKK